MENKDSLLHEEYKYQKLADDAKMAQRHVEILANLVNEFIQIVRPSDPALAEHAERCISRIPLLRRVKIDNKNFRYLLDIPIPLSPREENEQNHELNYLRELWKARYGIPSEWRFVTRVNEEVK